MKPRAIGIADCNNFYVSCERIFRPKLAEKPVIVMSNNDGCVIARSNEVKALKIPMGAPMHTIRHLVRQHDIQVFSANFALYGDISQRVMQELAAFAPSSAIQIYSIDEAFLDLGHVPQNEQERTAAAMKAVVGHNVGVPISVGVAPSKTLAKLANDISKKTQSGVLLLDSQAAIDELLTNSVVGDVWGIGPRYAKRLAEDMQIHTAADLARANVGILRRRYSVVVARTALELRGISCLPLEAVREPKQEICTSRSFGRVVRDLGEMREAVATYATRAVEKLRGQHSRAGRVMVFVHTNPFDTSDRAQYAAHCSLSIVPGDNLRAIIAAALRALEACYKVGYAYSKAGVILSEFSDTTIMQASLFGDDDPRHEQLQVVIDTVNAKWGRDTLRYGATGLQRSWKMKQSNRTPRYTTRWDELIEAK